ncbi:MAG: hypothetical protein Q7U78_03050 [Gallionella sp.]|nr:hypothetical protein [Gallionella sp.]
MTDEDRSAQQLAAINDNLAGLFAEYCQRIASPDLVELLAAHKAQRLHLVLIVKAEVSALLLALGIVPLNDAYIVCGESNK